MVFFAVELLFLSQRVHARGLPVMALCGPKKAQQKGSVDTIAVAWRPVSLDTGL
jgi:hypothetical protein